MSREIKFRVWNIEEKYYEDELCEFAITGEGFLYRHTYNINRTLCADTAEKIYIIEQFTGLHDSAGKDIYENDIVSSNNHWKGAVWWCEEKGQWWAADHALCELNNLKVIGNIHENSELLKGEINVKFPQ